jgi:DNA polymerase III subunit epsilon
VSTLTDVTAALPEEPRLLARREFVIVDVETTGWQPELAGITEIGAVRVSAGQLLGEYSALVNPGASIPADIAALTGITDAMVRNAPPVGAVLPCFLAFASGCTLAAHNAPFDVGFLTAACGASGLAWPAFPVLDTAALARVLLGAGEVPDCKLVTLASFFGARTLPCHRALPDAKATADVLQALLGRLAASGQPLADQRLRYATGAAGGAGGGGPRRRQWSPLSFWSRRTSRGSRRPARR